jgi:hypothetical protein
VRQGQVIDRISPSGAIIFSDEAPRLPQPQMVLFLNVFCKYKESTAKFPLSVEFRSRQSRSHRPTRFRRKPIMHRHHLLKPSDGPSEGEATKATMQEWQFHDHRA